MLRWRERGELVHSAADVVVAVLVLQNCDSDK